MKKLILFITLSVFLFTYTSCNKTEDNGSRGFADLATIVGDSENGYYCYLNSGGFVVSYSEDLKDIKRGYFDFYYIEDDPLITDGIWHPHNAQVYAIDTYDVIYPITKEEAEAKHITDKDSCIIPSFWSVGSGSYGYIDLSAQFATFNRENGETVDGEVNLVYDVTKQEPDTLRLQLCYNPRIPKSWSLVSDSHRTVSCDISSLASLQQWNDSVIVVIDSGEKEKHLKKISKNDFLKPDIKVDAH